MRSTWLEMTTAAAESSSKKVSWPSMCHTFSRRRVFNLLPPKEELKMYSNSLRLLPLEKPAAAVKVLCLFYSLLSSILKMTVQRKEECVKWLQKKIPFLWWQLSHTSTLVLPQLKSSIHRWWGWTWRWRFGNTCVPDLLRPAYVCLNTSKQFS